MHKGVMRDCAMPLDLGRVIKPQCKFTVAAAGGGGESGVGSSGGWQDTASVP